MVYDKKGKINFWKKGKIYLPHKAGTGILKKKKPIIQNWKMGNGKNSYLLFHGRAGQEGLTMGSLF